MGLLESGQADKIARQYRWLNFHPTAEMQAITAWFADSQCKFREHQQVYPLALQGETGSGRRYLLEAAHFRQTRDGLPIVIFHWDMEVWDAPTQQAQIEHMQARLEDFEQQLALQNPSLWAKLGMLLKNAESATVPVAGGEINLNLKGIWNWLFPPPRGEAEATGSTDTFAPVTARFRELLRDSHVILHVRRAELLDWGLPEKLRHTVKWLNAEAESGAGFMALALSFPDTFPLQGLLGATERYARLSLAPLSPNTVLRALRETYGQHIADTPFATWLLQHAALHGGAMDAAHLGKLLDKLLDEGLLTYINEQWQFAALDELERWKTAIGKNLEQQWLSRTERIPQPHQQTIHSLFQLAALGGEWIPVDVLLDYLGIRNPEQRDELIDLLDEVYGESPALLHCMNYQFAGMGGKVLVYRFASPLLPLLLPDPATSKQQASELLKWLQQRWPNPKRNQATYLLRLTNHADRQLASDLRERLAWQVETEFADALQVHLFEQLISHELSIATLDRIISKYHSIWPMPHRRAICRAWLSFYQHSLQDVSGQVTYTGAEWDELWANRIEDDLSIPATDEGLHLCFYYGHVEKDAGNLEFAESIFHTGLSLCNKYLSLAMQARFYGGIADILQARGQLDDALNIRENHELPVYEKLGDVRSKAVTMGQIADILQARGQLDDALNIRENHELPVYEKLGDVRLTAITKGYIADILQARGQLDDALNIRENHELPVYEKLGDVRSKAVTMGKIADILQARGQLDDALNIRENHELPVYEKLGDVRLIAITKGYIADILQARGQLDDALNIRQTEQLPVYEKLGDVRSKAVTMAYIADILHSRNKLDSFWQFINGEKVLPAETAMAQALQTLADIFVTFQKLQDARQIGRTYSQQADIHQVSGRLQQALALREKEIAVFTTSGYVHELLISRAKLAMLLWQLDANLHAGQITELLCKSQAEADKMKIPEAKQIGEILEQMGSHSPPRENPLLPPSPLAGEGPGMGGKSPWRTLPFATRETEGIFFHSLTNNPPL